MTAMHRRFRKHGLAGTKVYRTWKGIRLRCLDPNNCNYHRYGARGIAVWPEWVTSFTAFFEHVGHPPTDKHSIDRIDNARGYEPGNVRWATRTEQSRNTRYSRHITFNGRTMLLIDWANERCPMNIAAPQTPTFTRKLSWDEQRALSPSDEAAYWDWLFGVNEHICRRRELDQLHPNRDWDKERSISRDEDYEVTPRQGVSE